MTAIWAPGTKHGLDQMEPTTVNNAVVQASLKYSGKKLPKSQGESIPKSFFIGPEKGTKKLATFLGGLKVKGNYGVYTRKHSVRTLFKPVQQANIARLSALGVPLAPGVVAMAPA